MRSGRRTVLSALALIGLAVSAASPAEAGQILIYNTGVDASGNPLPTGAADPHYTLVSSPYPNGVTATVGNNLRSTWLPNDADSKWIGPGANLGAGYLGGTYVYRTTFDLTGFYPATATITGGLATDNNAEVFLNGLSTGITTVFEGFRSLKNFTINSGFVAGLNTLEFRVVEPGGTPTGLRVDNLVGTAVAVPEPTTVATLGLAAGLSLLGLVRRRNVVIA